MSIEIARDDEVAGSDEILTHEALAFVEQLHHRFDMRRRDLLAARHERRERIAAGEPLGFLPETADVRAGDCSVPPTPMRSSTAGSRSRAPRCPPRWPSTR